MMRKLLILAALGAATIPAASNAALIYRPNGYFDVYGSYLNQKFEGTDQNPDGGGVGIAAQLNLPLNFFLEGMYQYNNLHAPGSGFVPGFNEQQDQGRVGGGINLSLPLSPIVLFGKIDYVHYGVDLIQANTDFGTTNHDGGGYFIGAKTRGLVVNLYAQGGWLDLEDASGPEYLAGLSVPVARGWFGPIELFGQFRWDNLKLDDGGGHNRFYDYDVGFRFPF